MAVGSGDRCIPGDDSSCGDEGPAIKAKLAHPKGNNSVFIIFCLNLFFTIYFYVFYYFKAAAYQ